MQQRRAWEISQLHFGANLWGGGGGERGAGPDPGLKKRGREPPNLPCPLMSHRDLTYFKHQPKHLVNGHQTLPSND